MAHVCNLSTWEAGTPRLHYDAFFSKNRKTKKTPNFKAEVLASVAKFASVRELEKDRIGGTLPSSQ